MLKKAFTQLTQRIKTIKNLFLEKLDHLNFKTEQQVGLSSLLLEEINKTQHNTHRLIELEGEVAYYVQALNQASLTVLTQGTENSNSISSLRRDYELLLQNNTLLLKSSTDLIKGLQQFHQDSQVQQQDIYQVIESSYQAIAKSYQDFQAQQQDIYQAIAKSYQDSQAQQQAIYQTFQQFQQETQACFQTNQQTLNQIYQDIHNYKFKVILNQVDFSGIEVELMSYLYSWLPFPRALDIGANQGDVTERLLQSGYEVYAFEPFLPVVEKLKNRLSHCSNLHIFPLALGAVNEEKELHLVGDQNLVNDPSSSPLYPNADYTLLSSINIHSLPEGMVFTDKVPITVTTLETLHQQQQVPLEIGLVKIDTEGFDLQVIQGMGDYRYPVVIAEFWDKKFPFGQFGTENQLANLVSAMKLRNYHWFITIYRVFPDNEVSFYCNNTMSIENSWGNIFFFQDYTIFSEALKWCTSVMPATYFSHAY